MGAGGRSSVHLSSEPATGGHRSRACWQPWATWLLLAQLLHCSQAALLPLEDELKTYVSGKRILLVGPAADVLADAPDLLRQLAVSLALRGANVTLQVMEAGSFVPALRDSGVPLLLSRGPADPASWDYVIAITVQLDLRWQWLQQQLRTYKAAFSQKLIWWVTEFLDGSTPPAAVKPVLKAMQKASLVVFVSRAAYKHWRFIQQSQNKMSDFSHFVMVYPGLDASWLVQSCGYAGAGGSDWGYTAPLASLVHVRAWARLALGLTEDDYAALHIAPAGAGAPSLPAFLRAAASVSAASPGRRGSLHLVLAGPDFNDSALAAHLADMPPPHRPARRLVHTLPQVGDLRPLLAAADVYLAAWLCEPFGAKSLKAMALMKPVLASHCGATKELVAFNVTGLIHRYPSVDLLAANLAALDRRSAPGLAEARRMAQAACLKAHRQFNKERETNAWGRVFALHTDRAAAAASKAQQRAGSSAGTRRMAAVLDTAMRV